MIIQIKSYEEEIKLNLYFIIMYFSYISIFTIVIFIVLYEGHRKLYDLLYL